MGVQSSAQDRLHFVLFGGFEAARLLSRTIRSVERDIVILPSFCLMSKESSSVQGFLASVCSIRFECFFCSGLGDVGASETVSRVDVPKARGRDGIMPYHRT